MRNSDSVSFLVSLRGSVHGSELAALTSMCRDLCRRFGERRFAGVEEREISVNVSCENFSLSFMPTVGSLKGAGCRGLCIGEPSGGCIRAGVGQGVSCIVGSHETGRVGLVGV